MHLKLIYLLLLCVINEFISCNGEVLFLNGEWKLSGKNVSVKARVPGNVYTDLQRGRIIGDPLYRMNDVKYKWIGLMDWSYTRTFRVPRELNLNGSDLICEGLDTVASLKINGITIGTANNMHRRYVFDIWDKLKEGDNTIRVDFVSPVRYVSKQRSQYPYDVPPAPYFNFIRKAAYSFGWDWGPSFPSVGIWKNIYIKMYREVSLLDVKVQTIAGDDHWILKLTSYFDVANKGDGNIFIIMYILKELNVTRRELVYLKPPDLMHQTRLVMDRSAIELWWPRGMGEAKLYHLEVKVCNYSSCEESKQFFIGFRKVKLVEERVNATEGLTFYFKINDVPVFCKGTNWIPAGSFQGSIDNDQVQWLLESAAEANMNILRVWGGGVYESDEFYELADKLGIMVWQDFMLACALYPTDQDFLENVREEVVYQIRRLSHHPSIIIWSGNNENEAALVQNWFNVSKEMMETFRQDYIKLYVDCIREAVISEDLSRPFVTSSPSNGLKTMMDGWLSPSPQDERYGDIHFYKYSINGWNPDAYQVPRFASEFGFQSWPSFETLQPVSLPEDLKYGSNFSEHRQRHPNGNKEMKTQAEYHVKFPSGDEEIKSFRHFVYMTQVDQAMSIKTQVEHYMRHRSSVLEDGRGLTMGAMYWQLNDVWQAPTWSSVEYGGKWKILHYYAREFFHDYLVSPALQGEQVNVYFIINKGLSHSNCGNFSLTIECCNFKRTIFPIHWVVNFQQFKTVELIYQDYLKDMIQRCKCLKPELCFFKFFVSSSCDNYVSARNFLFPSNYFSNIPGALVWVSSVHQIDAKNVQISLNADKVALFVWIEAISYKGRFSDNGFHMTSGMEIIHFQSRDDIKDLNSFIRSIRVTCLSDVLWMSNTHNLL